MFYVLNSPAINFWHQNWVSFLHAQKICHFSDIKFQCIIKLVMFRWFFDASYRTLSLSWTLCDNLCQMYMSETTSKWQKNHFQSRLSIFEWRDWKCIFRAIELCFVSYNISIYITLYYFSKIISRFLRSPRGFPCFPEITPQPPRGIESRISRHKIMDLFNDVSLRNRLYEY